MNALGVDFWHNDIERWLEATVKYEPKKESGLFFFFAFQIFLDQKF